MRRRRRDGGQGRVLRQVVWGGLWHVTRCDGGGGLWRWGEHKVRLMDGMMQ